MRIGQRDDTTFTSGALGVARFTGVGCALVTLWLAGVLVMVLPVRDPARVPLWSAIALGFALAAVAGLLAGRLPVLARFMAPVSATGGALLLAGTLRSGRFEGYELVMGLLALVHGAALSAASFGRTRALRAATEPPRA